MWSTAFYTLLVCVVPGGLLLLALMYWTRPVHKPQCKHPESWVGERICFDPPKGYARHRICFKCGATWTK